MLRIKTEENIKKLEVGVSKNTASSAFQKTQEATKKNLFTE